MRCSTFRCREEAICSGISGLGEKYYACKKHRKGIEHLLDFKDLKEVS